MPEPASLLFKFRFYGFGPVKLPRLSRTGPRLRHIVKIVNRYFLIPKSGGGGLGAFETQVDVIIVSVIIYQGAR